MSEDFKKFYKDYFLDYWELKYKFLKDRIENYNECEEIYDSKGDFLVKNGNIMEALDNYQKSLDIGDEEYEFTAETKEKIKKYRSKLT